MVLIDFLKSNDYFQKWYQKLLWWEIMRVPYNLFMLLFGIGSLMIAALSIPILYILIGLGFNLVYSAFGIIEIFSVESDNPKEIKRDRKRLFFGYLLFSVGSLYSLALITLWIIYP